MNRRLFEDEHSEISSRSKSSYLSNISSVYNSLGKKDDALYYKKHSAILMKRICNRCYDRDVW